MTATNSKLNEILSLLKSAKKSGSGYMALCPAHDDKTPSLSITEKDGKILLYCFAGCSLDEILAGLEIDKSDLFINSSKRVKHDRGMPTHYRGERIILAAPFKDETGCVLYYEVKTEKKTFRPYCNGHFKLNGQRRVLYHLPELIAADPADWVFLCEGPKDANNVFALGLTATTNILGAKSWQKSYNECFRGKRVCILNDNDEAGRKRGQKLFKELKGIAKDVRVLDLPGLPEKGDVSDWIEKGGTKEELIELVEQKTDSTALSLNIISADQILEEELTWFWENRIPAGMYSFIVGDPGAGKSFLSCYMAAVATTGGVWADGIPFGDPIDVLMFVSEDHLSKCFIHRLKTAKADLKRVKICQWIQSKTKSEIPFVIQQNIDLLKSYLDQNPACKLVTLDPITGYMGNANQNSQADVRDALMPVKTIAEKMDVTVIGLSHLNKKVDMDMQHRSIGSVAFNAVPRAVWGVFSKDNDEGLTEDKRRFFFPIKDNLCVNPDAIEFTINNEAIVFGGKMTLTEFKNQLDPTKRTSSKKEQAKDIILNALNSGDIEADVLLKLVMGKGISERTATDARKELRVSGKIDTHNPEGKGFRWFLR